ncbi:hypothetical protein A0H81_07848 [Grifola frondosa]|uniref:Uncharacterized protein n=1 Tax=Grifola frondosa TaxID=5627 RepID=A0A1C7M6F3_GRIFR|nr:hypothetical protein A0H81_07848 [Grifola frondosa]
MEQGTDIQGGYTDGSTLTSPFVQEAVLQSMEGSTEKSPSISQLSNDVTPNPDVEGSRDDEHSR